MLALLNIKTLSSTFIEILEHSDSVDLPEFSITEFDNTRKNWWSFCVKFSMYWYMESLGKFTMGFLCTPLFPEKWFKMKADYSVLHMPTLHIFSYSCFSVGDTICFYFLYNICFTLQTRWNSEFKALNFVSYGRHTQLSQTLPVFQ